MNNVVYVYVILFRNVKVIRNYWKIFQWIDRFCDIRYCSRRFELFLPTAVACKFRTCVDDGLDHEEQRGGRKRRALFSHRWWTLRCKRQLGLVRCVCVLVWIEFVLFGLWNLFLFEWRRGFESHFWHHVVFGGAQHMQSPSTFNKHVQNNWRSLPHILTVHWFPWGRMRTITYQALIALNARWLVQNTTLFMRIMFLFEIKIFVLWPFVFGWREYSNTVWRANNIRLKALPADALVWCRLFISWNSSMRVAQATCHQTLSQVAVLPRWKTVEY